MIASFQPGFQPGFQAIGGAPVVATPPTSSSFIDASAARVVRPSGWGIPPFLFDQQLEAERRDHRLRLVEEDWLFGLITDQEYVARSA
jgi:hypothetical protein